MTTPWPPCICKKHVAIRGLKVSSLEDFELGYESSCKNLIQWIISMKYVVLAAKTVKNCHFCIFEDPPIQRAKI